jgi:hypothetical protein
MQPCSSSPPPSPTTVMPAVAVVQVLQELLLTREEVLTQREDTLVVQEEKARISQKALAKVSADLNAERTKAKATQREYLDKMVAHTAHAKHSLSLDKMLGEKNVELDGRERDLELCEATLAEAQTGGLHPRDNRDELAEFFELRRLLGEGRVQGPSRCRHAHYPRDPPGFVHD